MTDSRQADDPGAAALAAMHHAYAPYSHFRVGAALRAIDGSVVTGCNVENASFPAGTCAERGALAAAVARGHRAFDLLVVATEATDPTPPCGMCRQALAEFAPSLQVVAITTGGRRADWVLSDLLPQPFTPASLSHT
ncbi:cytidine deaminase [Gammaproteobacteria bacterium]|nr:cytidine deaminase [Gammaproteobacteria bacterium]